MSKHLEHLEIVLKEMCKRVGADFDEMEFGNANWFWQYTWKENEQDDFIHWMIKYLEGNKEARTELMHFPRKNLKDIKKTAESFTWNYGWKVKYEE